MRYVTPGDMVTAFDAHITQALAQDLQHADGYVRNRNIHGSRPSIEHIVRVGDKRVIVTIRGAWVEGDMETK